MTEDDSANLSKIEIQILRLKRELGADDLEGHTCDQCKSLRIPPLPTIASDFEAIAFFELDTTVKHIREELADSGCELWKTIQDLLTFVSLEARGHGSKDLWRRYIGYHQWGFSPSRSVKVDDAANWPNAVRVIMRCRSNKVYVDSTLRVEAAVHVPWPAYDKGDSQTDFRHCNEFSIPFLVMSLPGDLADVRRNSISAPFNLAPRSPVAINLAKHWIWKCEVEHGCGIESLPVSMPSLLLNVSNQHNIRVVDMSETMPERYIALSYCWGIEVQKVMLTKDTEDALRSGISPEQLDSTIRDSIRVVRRLGFRYLWVDALCIRQDDEAFKVTELQKMGDIFYNATFTIIASVAENVREGYLSRRAPSAERAAATERGRAPSVLKVKVEREDETEIPVILWPGYSDYPRKEPWYGRAWTLQETLLSRRRLMYRTSQTTWECHCAEATAYDSDGGTLAPNKPLVPLFHDFNALVPTQPLSRPSHSELLRYWYGIMEEYLTRKLTYARDLLLAISSIARELAAALEDEYICGLWKSDMATGLLWTSRDRYRYFAGERSWPSWSWSSTSGSVYGLRLKTSHLLEAWQNDDFEILAYDVDLTVPTAKFGNVNGARLYLLGLLTPMPAWHRRPSATRADADLGGQKAMVNWDYEDDPRHNPGSAAQLALLLVKNDTSSAWGLVLAAGDHDNEYSRLGHFEIPTMWPEYSRATKKGREECRERLRDLWGGKGNVRSIICV